MVLPNLLHPTQITIEQISRSTTIYDLDAREPVQHAARKTTVVVPGQVNWGTQNTLRLDDAGATGTDRGYVLFRKVDLDGASVTLEVGDRMTMQGHFIEEVYITGFEPLGHYPDQDGWSLLKAFFTDRLPSKQRRT